MQNRKNLMDKNIDAIKYEGVVTLKLIDEKTKIVRKQFNIHNEGSRNLFYFYVDVQPNLMMNL